LIFCDWTQDSARVAFMPGDVGVDKVMTYTRAEALVRGKPILTLDRVGCFLSLDEADVFLI
jgi:hypothetical protein